MTTALASNNTVGHLTNLDLDITQPIPMKTGVGYNALNIMVGANGTGKSLMLKLNYALGTILSYGVSIKPSETMVTAPRRAMHIAPPQSEPLSLSTMAQYIMDNTFEDQNFHGDISAKWERASLTMRCEDGKVEMCRVEINPEVTTPTPVIFMSSGLRLFSAIDVLLQTRNSLGVEKTLEMYRLYDLSYLMMLEQKIGKNYVLSLQFKEFLKAMDFRVEIQSIQITAKFCYTDVDGKQFKLASLSNGEQAMINMFLGAA